MYALTLNHRVGASGMSSKSESPPSGSAERRSPTQADIARAARVSTATVSRVLNHSPLVREEVRGRVEQAMARLGYFPHGAARALASNRSFTIGAILPTLNNAIFANGINAFEAILARSRYTLLLAVSHYNARTEATLVRRLLERGIDGLMLVGNDHSRKTYESLRRAAKPYVNTWAFDPARGHANIGFSNRVAIAQVVDHLVGLGHRRIGMLAGITAGNDRARERLEGVRERLAAHGLALAEGATVEIPYSVRAARRTLAEMIEQDALPSAMVCGNDVIALGVLFEALDRGIRVPEDLSVTGFDDLPIVEHVRPALTTVQVPARRMGDAAAQALVEACEKGVPVRSLELEATLLLRATTAPPATP
jgi:LacI family transcriptional regulator